MGSGTGKKVAGALDRITEIEEQLQGIVQIFQMLIEKNFSTMGKRLTALEEVANGLVGCVGVEGVTAVIEESRLRAAEARAASAKAALDTALASGQAVKVDVVSEDSVIAGVERDSQGNTKEPSRQQLTVSSMKQEFKEKIVGAGVGKILELPDGVTFTVTEIYDLVPQPQTDDVPAHMPVVDGLETGTPCPPPGH